MLRSFTADTAVEDAGAGRYRAAIVPGWDVHGNANGGYLLGIAARAMGRACGRPDPVTISAHYLNPGRAGAIEVDTRVVKAGKRFATVTASMRGADERPVIEVLGTFGDLAAGPASPTIMEASPPELPPHTECVPHLPGGGAPGVMANVELLLHPDDAGFRQGRPSGVPRVRGWFRLGDGAPLDTLSLLLAVDAFPPTVFNTRLPIGWVPTVELTVHVRARPAPGWARAVFTSRFLDGGFIEEDGEIWDAGGRMVAQSRQLALIPRAG